MSTKDPVRFLLLLCLTDIVVQGNLVIDESEFDSLDASRIETEGTLVDKILRDGPCAGAKVRKLNTKDAHD